METAAQNFLKNRYFFKNKGVYEINEGSCFLMQVNTAPVFSISKNGKDDLVVRSSSFSMKRPDTGEIFKYDCGAFELKGNCKDASFCTKTFNNCKRKTVVAIKTTTQRTTTTKRPTTTKATTIASTTKKKGLLDRILG